MDANTEKMLDRLLLEAQILNPWLVPRFRFKFSKRLDWIFEMAGENDAAIVARMRVEHFGYLACESMSLYPRDLDRDSRLQEDLCDAIRRLKSALV